MKLETAFAMDTSSIKYGPGVTREVGYEMRRLGAKRVMVVTDPKLARLEPVAVTMQSLTAEGIDAVLFDRVSVEPTDVSFKEAIRSSIEGKFDGYVGVGGGSSMDTAKAANLYATYPADFLAYVNAPIGEGRPVPGPVRPLAAIPTTTGTGSETTGVAVFDFLEMKTKTGIAHKALRPAIGIVDPENTKTLPALVVACSGLDVLGHGLESYTALPFTKRPAPESPVLRPAYQGSNPISDVWAVRSIEMVAANMVRAVHDATDAEARAQMLLAATFAGVGFGNAGCHLPHGMSYPIAGGVKTFKPEGYPQHHAMVPHGMAVIMTAPAVFRFTAPTDPEKHLNCARLMGADVRGAGPEDAGELLAEAIIKLIRRINMPNGLKALGYGPEDVDRLVAGTLPQHRVIKISPRPVAAEDLKKLFLESMTLW
ncbi:MAG: iron-containing alcohol dehydrogenase [SAR202 cluster bacterium]|nr:iron-containing alcohol dehydrogenase [SAR202 cluster bacterium]